MKKCAFHNLGCKVNAYETEAMQEQMAEAGYEIVPFEEKADVYVINTCSVTNIADRKSRQMIHRARKKNPAALIVAAGCYVQAAAEDLKKEGAVDIILGNNQKGKLAEALAEWERTHVPIARLADVLHEKNYEDLWMSRTAEKTRAFIKIQDGCNQFCSYCIIPYTRGRVRSRRPEEIVREVTALAEKGYQEVVLTGILLSAYGIDLEGKPELLDVVKALDVIPGLERIRLGSLEPRVITESFVSELAGTRTFCPHFHLSLQSGCDETLKRMNRHYTTREYLDKCRIIREYFEHPAITTDVITGFPGETEEEFETTEQFVQEAAFFEMHVFPYSRRKGTPAEKMPGQLTEAVKKARSARLLTLEKEMSRRFREYYIGRDVEVLLEEPVEIGGQTYTLGHTREYVKVLLPGKAEETNRIVRARVVGALDEDKMLAE
jgi:threonylcarbamoyladenosine tRNA methylthiotransferase MtaB